MRVQLFDASNLLKIEELNTRNDWIIIGGSALAAHGLRINNDIEIFVSEDLYDELSCHSETRHLRRLNGERYISIYEIDIFCNHNRDQKSPSYEYLKDNEDLLNGLPFVNLLDMQHWKLMLGRTKDIKDSELISNYMNNTSN